MVIRVVLRFSGDCLVKSFVETLQQAVFRHPFFRCRVVAQGRSLQWIDGTPAEPVVQRQAGSIFEPFIEPVNSSLDLKVDAGLKTEIRCLDDGVLVVMDVHHAVSDGNGMRQLITDWLHLYHSQITGTQARLPIMDPDRLQRRHLFPQPSAVEPISLRDGIRNFLVTVRGRTARWISTTLRKSSQANESSYCVEHVLSDAQYDAVQTRLAAYKVTLNDLMIVSCMSTFARIAPGGADEHRITVLNPTDLRLPSDRLLPATNRFGFAFLRRKRSECMDPARLLAGIHGEMSYIRSNYVGVEFIKGLETASRIPGGVDFFRKLGLFTPSIQWTCLGDVTRGARRLMPWKDGFLSSGGLKLETATGFAPFAENVPISVATCEAGRRLTLTVRSSSLKVTTEETKLFASTLVEQICQFQLSPCCDCEYQRPQTRRQRTAKRCQEGTLPGIFNGKLNCDGGEHHRTNAPFVRLPSVADCVRSEALDPSLLR
jgi:hypothetical protein